MNFFSYQSRNVISVKSDDRTFHLTHIGNYIEVLLKHKTTQNFHMIILKQTK